MDGLTYSIFMSISDFLLGPLQHIINLSFVEGVVPREIKIAKVKPLFKADDPHVFNNYRPISILPIISIFVDKLVHKRLTKYLKGNIPRISSYTWLFAKNTGWFVILRSNP